MREVTISLFQLSELSKESQQTAIDEHRYINTDDDWWDFVYDYFVALMDTLSIAVDKDSIHFNGFYSQGSGSSFNAVAGFTDLIKAVNENKWSIEFPDTKIDFIPVVLPARILRLIEHNHLEVHPKITASGQGYSIKAHLIFEVIGRRSVYRRIEACMNELEIWFEQIAESCNKILYRSLQTVYEELTDDEHVKDTIEANEYDFTIDGHIATRIVRLSQTSQTLNIQKPQ